IGVRDEEGASPRDGEDDLVAFGLHLVDGTVLHLNGGAASLGTRRADRQQHDSDHSSSHGKPPFWCPNDPAQLPGSHRKVMKFRDATWWAGSAAAGDSAGS